ncbi:MAG: MATE family efflux transporter [Lachnospiraceae bacterium]|nr:MATE family efflux transporter [Lachnospiraceae bacterium]
MNSKIKEYTSFYKKVLAVALPIMLQNGISNFVSLLDNIMLGRVGNDEMTGVAIVNQLLFIFYLCIFGAVSGAGIFTAQYYGSKDMEGVRDTFRFKLLISTVILVIAIGIFMLFNGPLLRLYLSESSEVGNIEATFNFGREYLFIMLIGLLPFTLENCYSGTLRETGRTVIPMAASVVAVFINLGLNYVLIYGKFGAPELGVAGAAYATVISRVVQLLIVVVWTHRHSEALGFIKGLYASFKVKKGLGRKIVVMGLPLIVNETLWAAGIAAQMQAYSNRGVMVVSGLNINSTIANVFNVAFIALGDAVAILVGQLLGAGKTEEAKRTSSRIIVFSVSICIILGTVLFFTAPLFPQIYNSPDEIKFLAEKFLRVTAICMPLMGFLHATYFTIRSGGKTFITFLFDSAFLWVVAVPVAYVLTLYTGLDIVTVFLLCNLVDLIKATVGFILLKKGVWINNLVAE